MQSFNDTGATTRNPRTAICFNDSHVFFMVVDGRDPGTSVGMTMEELGSFASNTLGATWCINQDGGGSSTMVVSGQVVNNPSDGSQRAVANGMLMVVVEPVERSLTFSVGEAVETTASTTVRLGPGTNYAAAATVAGGSLGTVRADFNGLDGVLAKGSHWWKVDFGDMAGWVDEAFLISSGPTPTPTDTPTSTPTPSATFTATNTPTASVTPTATITPSPSNTPTATPVPSDTPTATNTPTPTDTPASTTMHVGDLDGASEKLARGFWSAQVTISVHDDAHASVASVAVSATFYQNGTLVGSVACTTDSTGACTVDSGPFPDKMGKASFVVEDLSHGTLSYDAVSNHDPDGDSDGTSISLGK